MRQPPLLCFDFVTHGLYESLVLVPFACTTTIDDALDGKKDWVGHDVACSSRPELHWGNERASTVTFEPFCVGEVGCFDRTLHRSV